MNGIVARRRAAIFFVAWVAFITFAQGCVTEESRGSDVVHNINTLVVPSATSRVEMTLEVTPVVSDAYLVNPGIGWQAGPGNSAESLIPETVAYSNRREIAWRILNPAEGVFEWEALNAQFSRAEAEGKQFSFRVYSMVGEPFDGHMVPDWVVSKGALILPSGEPDYSNCVYQEEWGKFINELILRYDGHADLAFVDISGYGNFNEWSWRSSQTEWDNLWEEHYRLGTASPEDFQTLDGQARRRLADIFIGGTYQSHSCRMANGEVNTVSYSYAGFQKTQLVMPYAGIAQSTQYVFSRRKDVGFRFDCLGNYTEDVVDKVGEEINRIWRSAPVVYELCKPDEVDLESAKWMFQTSHGSLLHDNASRESPATLKEVIQNAGYRYFMRKAKLRTVDGNLHLYMEWQNYGLAPNYPKMGQDFDLVIYLESLDSGVVVYEKNLLTDITAWLPSENLLTSPDPAINVVDQIIHFPKSILPGMYQVKVGIVEKRRGTPILLAMEGSAEDGSFPLTTIILE